MKIYNNITELIGRTPLIRLNNFLSHEKLDANILAKLEYLNPTGSIKDRASISMIEDAEEKGILKKGSTIIEPTSGNTGIGLASAGTAKGYNVIMTMPETMSKERIDLIKAYGAKVVLTDGKKGMAGSVEKADELAKEIEGGVVLGQFVNMANPKAHYNTTGPEIYKDTDGKVDILVCGIGTGGTISGTAKYLKEQNKNIKVYGIEPLSSPLLTTGKAGAHKLQGLGANFVPDTLDTNIYDEIITVSNEDAYETTNKIAKCEGFLVGISSGAALYGATLVAKKEENKNKNIVVIFPDSGDRYLSTGVYNEELK